MADMTLDDVLEQSGVMLGAGQLPTIDQLVAWREVIALHLAAMGEPVLIGWLEAEPSATIESLAVYGRFVHSMMIHIGATRPEKLQERNGMFPLYTAPPASGDWDAVREVIAELGRDGGRLHDEWMHRLTAALPESKS